MTGLGLSVLAGCVQEGRWMEDVSGSESAVQSTPANRHFTVATTALRGALARAQRATGALLVPRRSPSGDDSIVTAADGTTRIRSTCGVTFIDRTHAITAAHCTDPIDVPNPPTRAMTVELYDVSPELDWRAAAKVTGKYPAYEHVPLAGQPGYDVTRLSCTVAARCAFGDWKCPEPARSAKADVALIECDPLPPDRQPVAVADVDDASGPVTAFWFHEIYDAPTSQPPRSDPSFDLFLHYTVADPTGAQNLHYFDDGHNDLLPLISSPWSTGTPRRRLGRQGTVVWTDLFGCHGTSGSGVMQLDARTNAYVLLGPVATASNDWGHDRLCTDLTRHAEGRRNASYTALEYTRALAALVASAP